MEYVKLRPLHHVGVMLMKQTVSGDVSPFPSESMLRSGDLIPVTDSASKELSNKHTSIGGL